VQTLSGVLTLSLEADGRVTVDMGEPRLEVAQVPFDCVGLTPRVVSDERLWPVDVAGVTRWLSVLSMGNPHAVQTVQDLEAYDVAREGRAIELHPRFPKRVNAGFVQVTGANTIAVRVWERGVGETLACGTGACAAAVSAIRQGLVSSPVEVRMRGGSLTIAWQPGSPVMMTGPAQSVYRGDIDLQALAPPPPARL